MREFIELYSLAEGIKITKEWNLLTTFSYF